MSEVQEGKKYTGKVIWFSSRVGIGFIAPDCGDKDIFVHFSNIVMEGFKTLRPDQIVEYEINQNHKGDQACNVRVIKEAVK